jgi:hypothetical protein
MEQATEHRKETTMRRRHLRIRRWLVLAFALVTLIFAASASAMPGGDGGGGRAVYPQQPVVVPSDGSSGFNWWYAAIGATVAVGVAAGGVGVLRTAGNRRRLAGQTH